MRSLTLRHCVPCSVVGHGSWCGVLCEGREVQQEVSSCVGRGDGLLRKRRRGLRNEMTFVNQYPVCSFCSFNKSVVQYSERGLDAPGGVDESERWCDVHFANVANVVNIAHIAHE